MLNYSAQNRGTVEQEWRRQREYGDNQQYPQGELDGHGGGVVRIKKKNTLSDDSFPSRMSG